MMMCFIEVAKQILMKVWGFIGSANVLIPIILFLAEKLLELWRKKVEPVFDLSQIQAYIQEKGGCTVVAN
jgi:hypothetical protein